MSQESTHSSAGDVEEQSRAAVAAELGAVAAEARAVAADLGAVAAELRAWLAEAWDPELSLFAWRARLVEACWATPTWPVAWHGRGLNDELAAVVEAELAAAGAVGPPPGFGRVVAAPTLLDRASDEQKRRHLRAIATGEQKWCELFSEPGSGSDLAGLTTTAQPRGDGGWLATGRKAWATGAHLAAYALLLARTDWDVPKHQGLTMFLMPLDRDGVTVREVRLMNGALTHEVLLEQVALEPADVVGAPGEGWSVAQTTLAHERRLAAAHRVQPLAAGSGRAVREAADEFARFNAVYAWIPNSRGRPDLLRERARGAGAAATTRQLIADAVIHERVMTITAGRVASAGPQAVSPSLVKLASSRTARLAADAHAALTGIDGLLADERARPALDVTLAMHVASLIGGTDEIQRNIVAERVLGLPRERQADAALPFRDVPTNDTTERPHGARAAPDA